MQLLTLLGAAWCLAVAAILLLHRRALIALWREPVMRHPVLIVESDDWGAGPLEQAAALDAIADCLARHHDSQGRSPVMTVALILALPEANAASRLRDLDSPEFATILAALHAGIARGMLAPQLHGMTHFWPPALARAALAQPQVAAWLAAPDLTEQLPSPLQSRWIDASQLPSWPLDEALVHAAVAEEVAAYTHLLGEPPQVVVPPTFVWTATVESAWAAAGMRVLVTPGRRFTGRDGTGRPAGIDKTMRNGESAVGEAIYLVRDDYFEPLLGHTPEHALAALARKTTLGRPCLLETHRNNFLAAAGGDPDQSLAALDRLYRRALTTYPNLRFLSCAELGRALKDNDPAWVEQDRRRRFTIWLRRVAGLPRFGKAARLIGLLPLLNLFDRPRP
ncbi:MAG: hypothetical protein Q8M09_12170 [Pseudomonadota bacterium]|nr:hypothetical protein [Pseudomonadota bacterium]MDP1904984.1 hypothetical protein [Pseudomonadota bacterium]MDP2351117.1 hypothetical protein [Pseudomonadota bacterium]